LRSDAGAARPVLPSSSSSLPTAARLTARGRDPAPIPRALVIHGRDLLAVQILQEVPDELRITRHRRFQAKDADLREIHHNWERALRRAVLDLPAIQFEAPGEEDPEAL